MGNVTATTFTTQTIQENFSEGSTVFGDTDDDTHHFSGSMKIFHTGSANGLHITGSGALIEGDITASGNISASGTITAISGSFRNLDVLDQSLIHI